MIFAFMFATTAIIFVCEDQLKANSFTEPTDIFSKIIILKDAQEKNSITLNISANSQEELDGYFNNKELSLVTYTKLPQRSIESCDNSAPIAQSPIYNSNDKSSIIVEMVDVDLMPEIVGYGIKVKNLNNLHNATEEASLIPYQYEWTTYIGTTDCHYVFVNNEEETIQVIASFYYKTCWLFCEWIYESGTVLLAGETTDYCKSDAYRIKVEVFGYPEDESAVIITWALNCQ